VRRFVSFHLACLSIALAVGPEAVRAEVLVAPRVQATGVEAQTAVAVEEILVRELEARIDGRLVRADHAARARPCVDPACASRRARRCGAQGALLASVTRLGTEYHITLRQVDRSGGTVWTEERIAASEEDLDSAAIAVVAARFGGFAGSPGDTTPAPVVGLPQHRGWSSQGPRVGTLSPLGDSYAGAGRLTSLAYVWRHQTESFNVEVVPALGVTWGGELGVDGGKAREWSLLDLFVAWTPVRGDVAPFIGGGLGLHALELERAATGTPFLGTRKEGRTAVVLALGCGVVFFRTYDFQLAVDLRYQHFAYDFDALGGDGAHGIAFSFGIQHR